jgi:hypothetical protein
MCVGTLSCVPGVPGAITGPQSNSTGSYGLSWGASSGVVDGYALYENDAKVFNGPAAALSTSVAGRGDGTYRYKVQACNSAGCSGFTPEFDVTVLLPPGVAGPISAPKETGPDYTVAWPAPAGLVDHYDFGESVNGGATWSTTSVTATSKLFTNKPYGTYSYQVRACNASGCSAYTAPATVTVITALSDFPDAPVVPPSVLIPNQGWVGALSGTPSVEGGAATYRIPIDVPPGRVGMQPELSLTYSSRNGNGIAGVGWAVSGPSTIYRCPRTLAQDGANRTVQQDRSDRLCYDGQRLVGPNDANYGTNNSEYRTELDQFARITLKDGDMQSWSSYFQVEHKSGRISQFEPVPVAGAPYPPHVWYLVREFDQQHNCISYDYSNHASRGYDQDVELDSIAYTGIGLPAEHQCTLTEARIVAFSYTSDRDDKRTTFRFGTASVMTTRLAAIMTTVGGSYVRRYELAYRPSAATGRSRTHRHGSMIPPHVQGRDATVEGRLELFDVCNEGSVSYEHFDLAFAFMGKCSGYDRACYQRWQCAIRQSQL